MSTHADGINQRIQKDGVVWHACPTCGRTWPFPKGVHTASAEEFVERDWCCQVCAAAEIARIDRETASLKYYAEATDLVCDTLDTLPPANLPERKDKLIAILRNAAHWMRVTR